ncbi:chemotaxis protein CheD [Acetanaerobacterium elongatum]|uniref:Probable chemoreceptor glutamine deamidase CheD n=2 Tax=Acetanaerobacterium elongatum TaxID=258515 RepID=A0A1G9ZDU5_9FIRM|nr:chemotaxis protein CheD [Acetanaerobacterium elongatum]SDN19498.1 chemotaxis protein CheD [Acetanaerobacterium elongatum]
MSNLVTVGISDMNVVNKPDRLITYALGSCVGICLFDVKVGVGGMAHIMLPSSTECVQNDNKMKFADTAIVLLIRRMEQAGASKARMTAKIAGGAQMFKMDGTYGLNDNIMNIGKRNVAAVKKALADANIRIVAEDVGLNYGRTVEFDVQSGIMTVRSIGKANVTL